MVLFNHDHDMVERRLLCLKAGEDANGEEKREIVMLLHRYLTPLKPDLMARLFSFCKLADSLKAAGLGTAGGHGVPNGPVGTLKTGAVTLGAAKFRTSARLFAVSSRMLSGGRPNRHSIIFKIEVWSY